MFELNENRPFSHPFKSSPTSCGPPCSTLHFKPSASHHSYCHPPPPESPPTLQTRPPLPGPTRPPLALLVIPTLAVVPNSTTRRQPILPRGNRPRTICDSRRSERRPRRNRPNLSRCLDRRPRRLRLEEPREIRNLWFSCGSISIASPAQSLTPPLPWRNRFYIALPKTSTFRSRKYLRRRKRRRRTSPRIVPGDSLSNQGPIDTALRINNTANTTTPCPGKARTCPHWYRTDRLHDPIRLARWENQHTNLLLQHLQIQHLGCQSPRTLALLRSVDTRKIYQILSTLCDQTKCVAVHNRRHLPFNPLRVGCPRRWPLLRLLSSRQSSRSPYNDPNSQYQKPGRNQTGQPWDTCPARTTRLPGTGCPEAQPLVTDPCHRDPPLEARSTQTVKTHGPE